MLAAEGMTEEEVLDGLPYDSARAPEDDSSTPDARRYRDYKHVCGQVGLLYENDEGLSHSLPVSYGTRPVQDESMPRP
jgi:hypothetical protein